MSLWQRITKKLVEEEACTVQQVRGLSKPKSADEVMPILRQEKFDSGKLLSVLSFITGLQIFDPAEFQGDVDAEKGFIGEDAWLLFNNIIYITNPFSSSLQEEIEKTLQGRATGGYGIIPDRIKETPVWSAARFIIDADANIDTSENDAKALILLKSIIDRAINMQASDIHLYPNLRKQIEVRFRIDGSLIPIDTYDIRLHDSLESIIMDEEYCNVRLQTNKPQGGSFTHETKSGDIFFRVERFPCLSNRRKTSKYTIRQFMQTNSSLTLSDLPLHPDDYELCKDAALKSAGIIYLTGPTGAGKSTTLFAFLREAMKLYPDRSYNSVEDPVEQEIDGINQIEVDGINITFAAALKTLMRSDPDVILLGEIRDSETAKMAVDGAMTGHLFLTTLHVTTAHKLVDRMREMGTLTSMIGESTLLVISQRLVRKLCNDCKKPYQLAERQKENLLYGSIINPEGKVNLQLYEPVGCKSCEGIGYKGRYLLAEVLNMSADLSDAIINGSSMSQFRRNSIADGSFRDIWENSLMSVKEGITTLDEIARVLPSIETDRPNLVANKTSSISKFKPLKKAQQL